MATTTTSLFGATIDQAAASTTVLTGAALTAHRAAEQARIVAASSALTTDETVTIPGMAPGALYPWQQAAVVYGREAIARHGGVIIGDDMGLGKTRVGLALAAEAQQAHGGYILVVAPPANEGGYMRELRDAFPHLTIFRARGRKATSIPKGTDVVWMSDDTKTMGAWLTMGEMRLPDGRTVLRPSSLTTGAACYIRDEAHRDKGNAGRPATSRSRAAVSLMVGQTLRDAGRPVIAMTGTLTMNRPVDALLPIKIAGGVELVKAIVQQPTEHSFLVRYCTGKQTMVRGKIKSSWDGADNLPELHNRLRATAYVRREKGDLGEGILPHFGWTVAPFALGVGIMTRYNRIAEELLALILAESGPEAAWRASKAEALIRMMSMWAELGRVKGEAAVRYVLDLLDDDGDTGQAVVFYQHDMALNALREGFLSNGVVTGEINGSTRDRRKVEEDFQRRPAVVAAVTQVAEVLQARIAQGLPHARTQALLTRLQRTLANLPQVMLAQLQAASQALTLTAARHAVFMQLPWSAGALAQARDRIRRCDDQSADRAARGEAVHYHVMQATQHDGAETFDRAMWTVVERKAEMCDAVNAGTEVTIPTDAVAEAALCEWFAHL